MTCWFLPYSVHLQNNCAMTQIATINHNTTRHVDAVSPIGFLANSEQARNRSNPRLRGLVGSALDHRSLPPEFESWRRRIWRVFHLWLRFINFGGRSAHLPYHVHKSGRKISINHHHHYRSNVTQISYSVLPSTENRRHLPIKLLTRVWKVFSWLISDRLHFYYLLNAWVKWRKYISGTF